MTGQFREATQPEDIQLLLSRVRMEYARQQRRRRNLRAMWITTTLLAAIAAAILISHCAGAF